MLLTNVTVTDHARQRFLERVPYAYPDGLKDPDTKLKMLLKKATREKVFGIVKLYRAVRHSDQDTLLYVTECGWRFVVAEDGKRQILVTVERVNPEQNHPYPATEEVRSCQT